MSDKMKSLRHSWRQFSKNRPEIAPDINVGISASYTIDLIKPLIGGLMLAQGYKNPIVRLAEYNQIFNVCLDPDTQIGAKNLDTIIILWRLEDIADTDQPNSVAMAKDMMLQSISTLRDTFDGTIVVALPPRPRTVTEGLVGFARPSQMHLIWMKAQLEIAKLSQKYSNLYTIDSEAIIGALGEETALDYRMELLYRQPLREPWFLGFAQEAVRILSLRNAEPKKCLVLDCDNTIWGGVVGEDGISGIQISNDMPGYAFREFQRQVVALRQTGVFVALASKNNPEAVWEVFEKNDAMVLKRSDIAAARINWRPKSENLKEIAAELNIGLDALVFLDDSAFECEEIRTHAPEVTVFQIPQDGADIPPLMQTVSRLFDRLDITEDDRKRVDMILLESERRALRQKMTEDEFLSTLSLEVFIYEPSEMDLARVTQLINKTNQFNVTTIRYTLAEIKAFLANDKFDIYCATVRDKFGDYGLVGIAIVEHSNGYSEFNSLLMSCRVIGRGIETSIIEHGKRLALAQGHTLIKGTYCPTRKNQMVEDLYSRHNFDAVESDDKGGEEFQWQGSTQETSVPDYLSVMLTRPN